MKYIIAFLLLTQIAWAQGTVGRSVIQSTDQVYTKSNYTTATADTTGYLDIGKYSEVGYIIVSTDSANFDVYFDGKNSVVTGVTTTYADSLVTTVNAGSNTSVVIKSTTVNRLPNEDLVRFRVMARNTNQGTTSGRTLKIRQYSKTP